MVLHNLQYLRINISATSFRSVLLELRIPLYRCLPVPFLSFLLFFQAVRAHSTLVRFVVIVPWIFQEFRETRTTHHFFAALHKIALDGWVTAPDDCISAGIDVPQETAH